MWRPAYGTAGAATPHRVRPTRAAAPPGRGDWAHEARCRCRCGSPPAWSPPPSSRPANCPGCSSSSRSRRSARPCRPRCAMQQKVTELAIKGDRALGVLHPAEDEPAWATFDDEEPPAPQRPASTVTAAAARRPPAAAPRRPDRRPTPAPTAAEVAAGPPRPRPARRDRPSTATDRRHRDRPERAARLPRPDHPAAAGPAAQAEPSRTCRRCWPGRRAHDDRPAFVTMLTNRITTVTEG